MDTKHTTEILERIRERITNRSKEIEDMHDMIVNEQEREYGLTLDEAQSILDMLLSFNRDDEARIERLTCSCGFPVSSSCVGCLEG